jgi:hypothetical protein
MFTAVPFAAFGTSETRSPSMYQVIVSGSIPAA